ncbi:MAG: family 43 glycosylhydrolase [Lachnospiraceae bacterium]|nr:family 43 glycosylhydrolase [Lachnospiraceae bacterium]
MQKELQNGAIWLDTNGNVIHAHGGYILEWKDFYYWYGENRLGDNYISCYRSHDLINWEFRNNVLTTRSATKIHRVRTDLKLSNEDGSKVNIERPKVLYNEKTGKFVMWMHMENGKDYSAAACAIAICDTPDGNFTYLGSFRPYGYMSRDCTLFKDVDNTAYFVSAARDNADLHIYRLSEDYLNVDALVNRLWQGEYREAPAIMRKGGTYYMFSSYCTGWDPNQCKFAVSDSMEGRWSILHKIGDSTTYQTQPAFIFKKSGQYYYFADRWNGKDYHDSRYVVLPIHFKSSGRPYMDYEEYFRP